MVGSAPSALVVGDHLQMHRKRVVREPGVSAILLWQRGRLRKWKIPIAGVYYGLLWFITDITGLFLKILLTLDQDPQNRTPNPYIWGNPGKTGPIHYGYYGHYVLLQNITVCKISPSLHMVVC